MTNPQVGPNRRHFCRMKIVASALLLFFCVIRASAAPVTFKGVVRALNTVGAASVTNVVTDASGTVYVADSVGNQIIKVTPEGNASPLAITGLTSPSGLSSPKGLAISPVSGALYIVDSGNNRVVRVNPETGAASVLATPGFNFNIATGVAVDTADNVFVADAISNWILKITSNGTAFVLNTSSGTSLTGLSAPGGLAVDTYGSLYIADTGNDRVIKVTPAGVGSVPTSALVPALIDPSAVAVSNDGTLYISDTSAKRIVRLSPTGTATNLPTGSTSLNAPFGVAVGPMGKVYVADNGSNQVLSIEAGSVGFGHMRPGNSGTPISLPFTIGGTTTLTSVKVFTHGTENLDFTIAANSGTPCTIGSNGIDCTVNVQFTPTGPGLRRGALVLSYAEGSMTVPLYGIGDAPVAALSPGVASVINTGSVSVAQPFQTVLDGVGNIYVTSYQNSTVTKIPAGGGQGTTLTIPPLPTPKTLNSPTGLAMDGAGNLFIADYNNHRIVRLTPAGTSSVVTINGLSGNLSFPTALAFDGAGNLWINDYGHGRIVKVSPSPDGDGTVANGTGSVISLGSIVLGSDNSTGITVDTHGTLYIPDQNNSRILTITPSGMVTPLNLPSVILNAPLGTLVDGFGNLYIVDSGNQRIIRRTSAGVVSVLPFSGVSLGQFVFGITADPAGNLIVSDFINNRLVSLNVSQSALAFPSTRAGETSAAKTVTVTNLGNQNLQFAADPVYPTHFSAGGSATNPVTADTVLAPGASGEVSVAFTPQTPGGKEGTVTLKNNSQNVSNTTQTITVTGTALNPIHATAVMLTPTPASLKLGESLSLTAQVTDTTAQSTPTGGVSFTDQVGSNTISLNGGNAVMLDNTGKAVLSGVTLSGAGTHTITASYGGANLAFSASSSTAQVTVNRAEVSITGPASLPVQVTVGQAGSVPITVAGVSAVGVPTGTLNYDLLNSSNVSVASASLPLTVGTASSTATIPLASTLEAGNYTLHVSYGGDSSYAPSVSPVAMSIRIDQLTPVITWADLAAITYGSNLSAVLNASAVDGNTEVAGTMTFTATPSGGSADTVTSATVLRAGNYTLRADFTPTNTARYVTATRMVLLTVNKAALTVTADSKSITYGEAPHYTATIAGFVGSETAATAVTGAADFSVNPANPTAAGSYTITPALGTLASSNYSFSFVPATLTIGKATPALTLTTSANPTGVSTTVTFTATAPPQATGNVVFYDGTTALGTAALNQGTAALTTSSLSAATHSITAVYAGDSNFIDATSTAVSQVVSKAKAVITLASSPNPAQTLSSITFTATAPPQATGTIEFYDGTTMLGSSPLDLRWTSSIMSRLSAGTHSITASYDGDNYFSAATSAVLSLNVDKVTPTLTLTTSGNPTLVSTALTFTATAPPQVTGTVTFYDGTTALGTVALTQGTAALTTSSLSAATHSITATYSGDDRYNAVTSSAVAQVITDYCVTGSTPGGSSGATGSVPTQVVSPGGTALFNLTLTPTVASGALPLTAPMTLTVTDNLPAGSLVALTAPGITGGSRTLTLPAGSSASGVQLQVQLPGQSAGLHRGNPLTTLPFAFGILMLPFGGKLGCAAGKRARRSGLLLLLALMGLMTIAGLSGCGAMNSGMLAEQNYTITVTATSGSLVHSTTFNLTVR